jgi:hypothetical protein
VLGWHAWLAPLSKTFGYDVAMRRRSKSHPVHIRNIDGLVDTPDAALCRSAFGVCRITCREQEKDEMRYRPNCQKRFLHKSPDNTIHSSRFYQSETPANRNS